MKRQWDILMDQAARIAVGFDRDSPMIRPEFALAALFYVRHGVCQKIFEYVTTEEEGFQAMYLECLAHHYTVSLPDALNSMEWGKIPQVPMSPIMKKIVRGAKGFWREDHATEPPVDYLLRGILTYDECLPVMELCLEEAMMNREALYSYLVDCSRHFGGSLGMSGIVMKTYTSFADFSSDFDRSFGQTKPEPKAKTQKSRDIGGIEKHLRANVIGQDQAIAAVMRALKKDAAGLKEEHKPVGVFIFAGPTGVGKTELARMLASATKMAFHRFDMSEYGEKHEVSRLYGSPPGYVGNDDGGQLTNFVLKNPQSIILFDEVDKAHPDVLDVLLQIAEEETLTDGLGKTVKFADSVVIITTNAGSAEATKRKVGFGEDGNSTDFRIASYKNAVEKFFRAEIRGRMTDIIIFNDLSPEQILTIAGLELEKLSARIKKSRDITLTVAGEIAPMIVERSDTKTYGARNLKRTIDAVVAESLADRLLESPVHAGTAIHALWITEGRVDFKVVAPKTKSAKGSKAK
ncbi:MAG: AAA family ATPase [Candidatus Saccharimonadales bacterium]